MRADAASTGCTLLSCAEAFGGTFICFHQPMRSFISQAQTGHCTVPTGGGGLAEDGRAWRAKTRKSAEGMLFDDVKEKLVCTGIN
jgi:hypothetical protein